MRALVAAGLVLVLAACSSPEPGGNAPSKAPAPAGLKVEEVAGGFQHAWDIGFLPDGSMLVTERPGRIKLVRDGQVTPVDIDLTDVQVRGEGGLMGLVIHPDNQRFTVCYNTVRDVRLVTFRLDGTKATKTKDLLTGMPSNPSGRHSGCRPTLAPDGSMFVATGDIAQARNPQDKTSLGGKVLRIDPETGEGAAGNPFITSANANERRVYSFGHRNVQGVVFRPGSDQVFSSEHGPDVDDEVNLVQKGANYGWDPSKGGTQARYDESVPMTDLQRFPDAVPAAWSSGSTTEAICQAAFWNGKLAITALKGSKLLLFTLDAAGKVQNVSIPEELNDRYGRLRAARTAPDGSLYVTSSNGTDDKLLRLTGTA
ncbi:Glucose/arabinose dehydrogenase, beta-propeller fold [Lentzea waywayandensis]|uniref:Glucose/arabinose dehydrogenase, beta-propeller fold n=1 Tax=Lentzea waywayandensis TaxID=84724 RepID=A0A1I6FB92_9PSEU|nr:PQQ-dependent sugar dehydrogenase [Lentzea waywayandensis]SFR27180.1 Glucose/arabinose dehydrogenase, beta-propeller fold [Lentzea waywayandensis]